VFSISFCGSSEEQQSIEEEFSELQKVKVQSVDQVTDIEEKVNITQEKPDIRVSIGIYKSVSSGIILLGDALGYFNEVGLYPKIICYSDYESLVKAFQNGTVDMAPIGLYESIQLLLDEVEFLGVLPLTYKGITLATHPNSSIRSIRSIINGRIAISDRLIDRFLLHKGLKAHQDIEPDDLSLFYVPRTQIFDAYNKGLIDGGFFTSFECPPIHEINVIFEPTRFASYKVETMLVSNEFAEDNREGISLFIKGYKNALATYKQHRRTSIEIITHENRLNVSQRDFEKAVAFEPVIEVTDRYIQNRIEGVTNNENVLRNMFFHPNGIYNKEANEILDYIIQNVEPYTESTYRSRVEDIKLKLLRSTYFNILYLAETGFDYIPIQGINVTEVMKNQWKDNIRDVKSISTTIDFTKYGLDFGYQMTPPTEEDIEKPIGSLKRQQPVTTTRQPREEPDTEEATPPVDEQETKTDEDITSETDEDTETIEESESETDEDPAPDDDGEAGDGESSDGSDDESETDEDPAPDDDGEAGDGESSDGSGDESETDEDPAPDDDGEAGDGESSDGSDDESETDEDPAPDDDGEAEG
jgi:ABC-type nitrate/sulfonate/bicarbonate transport system substrate-binding protein